MVWIVIWNNVCLPLPIDVCWRLITHLHVDVCCSPSKKRMHISPNGKAGKSSTQKCRLVGDMLDPREGKFFLLEAVEVFFFVNWFFAQLVIVNLRILNPEDSLGIYCRWWFEQMVLMFFSTKLDDDTPVCGSYNTPPFFHWMISSFCPTEHLFSERSDDGIGPRIIPQVERCVTFLRIYIYMQKHSIHTGMPPHLQVQIHQIKMNSRNTRSSCMQKYLKIFRSEKPVS